MAVESQLQALLSKHTRLGRDRFCVAVSGGRDSMTLMTILTHQIPKNHLCIAHFDHRVRKDSHRDAAFVARWAKKQRIRFILGKGTGRSQSENALRQERMAFLKATARREGAQWIILGHHADDLLETFLMRLMRGTGVRGLGAIRERNGRLLRPMLKLTREEIRNWANVNGVPYREDGSNTDTHYFRNRIRENLVPEIKNIARRHGSEGHLLRRIIALSEEAYATHHFVVEHVRRLITSNVVRTSLWTKFSLVWFNSLPAAVKNWVLGELFERDFEVTLERKTVNRLVDSLLNNRSLTVANNIQVTVSCQTVYCLDQRKKKMPLLSSKGECAMLGMQFRTTNKRGGFRFLHPGDRFNGKKLTRLLMEKKVPAPERRVWPVFEKKGKIIWYLGYHSKEVQIVKNISLQPFA